MELALVSLAAVVARLPRSARERLGDVLGWLAGSVLRIRRRWVEFAMKRAAVGNAGPVARAMYRSLGRALVELLSLAGAPAGSSLLPSLVVDEAAVEALDSALARGPVVLFASHTGNWELAAAAAARLLAGRGRALYVVAKRLHVGGVDAFLRRLRERLGLRLVAPEGALATAVVALTAGHVVAMPIDQVPDAPRHGLPVPFLGELALVDRAPATLAHRARATVLVVAADRERVRLLLTIAPPTGPARPWIERTTTTATAALEAFVRARPEAWLWLHRRWRQP